MYNLELLTQQYGTRVGTRVGTRRRRPTSLVQDDVDRRRQHVEHVEVNSSTGIGKKVG